VRKLYRSTGRACKAGSIGSLATKYRGSTVQYEGQYSTSLGVVEATTEAKGSLGAVIEGLTLPEVNSRGIKTWNGTKDCTMGLYDELYKECAVVGLCVTARPIQASSRG
jgi:hypothetical protein